MDNLLKIGISQDTIDRMITHYNEGIVANLDANYDDAFKVLSTLKTIGVKEDAINDLLIHRLEVFTMNHNKFVTKLRNYNIKKAADDINFDTLAVEDIFFS